VVEKVESDPKRYGFHRSSLHREQQLVKKKMEKVHDTVGVIGIDAVGHDRGRVLDERVGIQIAGRVGDSPIIGAGLYVDPKVGAAVATGKGELMQGVCATFLAVERMRMGDSPEEAIAAVLERVDGSYKMKKRQQCALIVLRADGEWSSGGLLPGFFTGGE
jgi:N4-(beta-N-acetylglucosaminyl)-L-asparaginase